MSPYEIASFWKMLTAFDNVEIEEGRNIDRVTFENYKTINTGNSSMHYVLSNNNCRIVLQIHKNGHRIGNVDVVQGKPELDQKIMNFVNIINAEPRKYTDDCLNKLFIEYFIFLVDFIDMLILDPNTVSFQYNYNACIWWSDGKWTINADEVSPEDLQNILDFIKIMKNICGE